MENSAPEKSPGSFFPCFTFFFFLSCFHAIIGSQISQYILDWWSLRKARFISSHTEPPRCPQWNCSKLSLRDEPSIRNTKKIQKLAPHWGWQGTRVLCDAACRERSEVCRGDPQKARHCVLPGIGHCFPSMEPASLHIPCWAVPADRPTGTAERRKNLPNAGTESFLKRLRMNSDELNVFRLYSPMTDVFVCV